jgi:tetratricopeptide (TPR) repeat protein
MSSKRETKASGEKLHCTACGTKSDPSDAFCRKCGAPLGDAKPNGKKRGLTGLQAFGLVIIALAVIYAAFNYGGSDQAPPSERIPLGEISGSGQAAPQPLTPRAAADALFNQALTAHESGDPAEAQRLVPMAIAAYEELESIDPDGRYHLALLSMAAGRPNDALAQADTMFVLVPEHLLALAVSARAYEALGDDEQAADRWQRFLDAYTPEVAASRQEYMDHGRALPLRRDAAERFLREH